MTVRIGIIGSLRIERDDKLVTPSQPKLRQLLSLLAINAGAVVRTETITEELWQSAPSAKLARIVQTYVSQLRKLLGSSTSDLCTFSHTPRVGYQLRLDPPGYLDVTHFLRLREQAEREQDTAAAAAILHEAVELCRGHALRDVSLGPVLRAEKSRLDSARVGVLDRYLRARLELGQPDAVLDQADRIVREDTKHEELYASLMLAFAAVGQRAEATDLFHDLRRRRVEESGLEPGNAVRTAFQQVLRDDSGAASQVADLRTEPACESPAQLPPDGAGFVGFGPQLEAATSALARSSRPAVVAVVGPPGAGTSTFCVRAANRVAGAFPDGQLYADLAECDSAEVLAGFLQALRPNGPVPADHQQRARLFRRYTKGRRVLVLLDNVREGVDVAALRPGSAGGAMLLACASRLSADLVTATVDLPRLGRDELLTLLTNRVGRARIEREPAAARSLVARCGGLPLPVAVLATIVRLRPHWSLDRLARRLDSDDVPLAAGGLDLAASVRRSARSLGLSEWCALVELARAEREGDLMSVGWVATTLGISVTGAEGLLERLVETRLADPVTPRPDTPVRSYRYRVESLYLRAARELAERATPRPAMHLAPAAS